MSNLTPREKVYLEKLFGMSKGYVLGFSDSTFGNFFGAFDIDIHSEKYCRHGDSKAKKLREFWSVESDTIVAKILHALIEHKEATRNQDDFNLDPPNSIDKDAKLIEICKEIASRLCSSSPHLESLKQTAKEFNARYLTDQIYRIENAIVDDPELAIGTSKELVETCCKTILVERGQAIDGSSNLSKLTKATMKELQLLPDGIPDSSKGSETIKRLLQNLATITQGLAEIRNLYGTGHGRHGKTKVIGERHARLAVGASTTLCRFLWDTHEERKNDTG